MIENTKPEMTDVDALVCHPDNPRLGNVSMIVESIQHNGWYGTVIAQKSTKFVLAGNHRLKAAREIGIDRVPVIWLDVEDDKARRILLADNRTSDVATYDEASLMQLLKECTETEIGLLGTGYDDHDLEGFLNKFSGEAPESSAKEIDVDSFELEHVCPKCGFEFNL